MTQEMGGFEMDRITELKEVQSPPSTRNSLSRWAAPRCWQVETVASGLTFGGVDRVVMAWDGIQAVGSTRSPIWTPCGRPTARQGSLHASTSKSVHRKG